MALHLDICTSARSGRQIMTFASNCTFLSTHSLGLNEYGWRKRRTPIKIGLLMVATFFVLPARFRPTSAPVLDGKSWILLDATRHQVIASKNADTRIEPASLTKFLTAYLVFAAIQGKNLDLHQLVLVSTYWARAPASRCNAIKRCMADHRSQQL